MSGREPAWRLCVGELLDSTVEQPATAERAASYLLTPVGARVNRILLAGTISPPESRGGPDGSPFWRARLSDPTGTVEVTAGRFQPRALVEMQAMRAAGPALVVGKPNRYTTRDGRSVTALRAESLRACSPREAAGFQREAAEHLASRIALRERILAHPSLPDAEQSTGLPARWVAAQRESIRGYPALDLHRYRELVGLLRGAASESPAGVSLGPDPPGAVRVSQREEPSPASSPTVDPREEAILFEEVDRLAEESEDGYADLEAVAESATPRGVPRERVVESVTRLVAQGALEEPLFGKLRRAS